MSEEERRDVIHPEYPFTEDEHAAAWILLGTPASDARQSSSQMRADLSEQPDAEQRESGWVVGPRVVMTGQFRSALHLAADVHSNGSILSATAREAWLNECTVRLSHAETEQRLNQLDTLGSSWSAQRQVFHRLLTTGEL